MRYILVILSLFCCSVQLSAQRQSITVSPVPDWLVPYHPDLNKKPDDREIRNGYYLLLFEEQHHAEKGAIYRHIIRQIVSEAGIQNGAEISIDFDPAYEKLHFHQLIIRRNGQVINKLSTSGFKFLQKEEELSRFIYSGTYTAYNILEDVRKGDQIEYAYTLEGNNPIFEHKYTNSFYFTSYDPIVNFYKALIAAPTRNIHFKPFNGAKLPVKSSWKGMQLYEWKIADVMPPDDDEDVPEWYVTLPFVQASEYQSWQEIIDWGIKINIPPPGGKVLQEKIAELKAAAGEDKAQYLQLAMRFVQDDIRYMGIEMGEYSHRPNTPDKILSQRFGDCKDKSLLLTTLLQADGISASMAYTNTFLKAHVVEYLPSPFMFNHVIVYAQLGDSTYWIDPTISYQRGPLSQHTIPDYQAALIIRSPGSSQLTPIPQLHKGKIIVKEYFRLPDSRRKKGTLSVNTLSSLQFADEQRDAFANNSIKDQERTYLTYYKDIYGDLKTDSALKVIDLPQQDQFRIIEHYQLNEPWKKDSTDPGHLTIPVTAGIVQEALPATRVKASDAPLAMRYPYALDYTIDMDMPVTWSFDDPPLNIRNQYYAFTFTPAVDGKHVSFHYTFETFQDYIPAKAVAQYERDRKRISNIISFNLFWTPDSTEALNTAPRGGVNWVMVVLGLFFLGLFGRIAWKYNLTSILPVQEPLMPAGIRGLSILVAIIVFIAPFNVLINIVYGGFFSYKIWQELGRSALMQNTSLLQLWLMVRMVANIFFLVYSLLLVVLFYNKRDTFPNAMVYFLMSSLLFLLLDAGIAHIVYRHQGWDKKDLENVTIAFVKGLILTPYLLHAAQVKATFIMPHPSVKSKE